MKRINLKWRCRDGQSMSPACMTCSHLRNAIAMILKNGWRLAWLDILTEEYERRCKPPKVDIEGLLHNEPESLPQ